MTSYDRASVEAVLRLADDLESAAFRWGSLCSDLLANPLEWEEARHIVRARRTALQQAIAALYADSRGYAQAPLDRRHCTHPAGHLEPTQYGDDVRFCDACGSFVHTIDLPLS